MIQLEALCHVLFDDVRASWGSESTATKHLFRRLSLPNKHRSRSLGDSARDLAAVKYKIGRT